MSPNTRATLSSEEIQAKAERGPLFRRFAWSAALILGTVGIASIIAWWVGPLILIP
jgi:hypothetical protein